MPIHAPSPRLPPVVQAALFGVAMGLAGILVVLVRQGLWLWDAAGQPMAVDFVAFWSASRMAMEGHAAGIYDVATLKAAEDAALGHAFAGSLGWFYPPHFLLAVWPLAFLPLVVSQLAWTGATLALYAAVTARIGGRDGLLLALSFPAILATLMVGQNGFLIAALLGGSLLALERRPVLAGLLVGALSIKPHFGLLIPLALAAGGHWRVVSWAAASTLALCLFSALLFGADVWVAFAGSLAGTHDALIAQGVTGYDKLQSLFGLLRHLGIGLAPALSAQGVLAGLTAVAVVIVWRRSGDFTVKAAALSLGIVLATPYVYLYDLPLLAVPIVFLSRRGFDRIDLGLVLAAMLAALSYAFLGSSAGFGATVLTAVLVLRHAWPAPAGLLLAHRSARA